MTDKLVFRLFTGIFKCYSVNINNESLSAAGLDNKNCKLARKTDEARNYDFILLYRKMSLSVAIKAINCHLCFSEQVHLQVNPIGQGSTAYLRCM